MSLLAGPPIGIVPYPVMSFKQNGNDILAVESVTYYVYIISPSLSFPPMRLSHVYSHSNTTQNHNEILGMNERTDHQDWG